jgi:serine/threonine-protein kinase
MLFDHIGRGGMADIYLAQAETSFGASRLVVVKEVLAKYAASARFAELLVAEAKLAARLRHANIVQVEDLGREEDALFIAMDYVEGFDLRELLSRCAKERVPLPVEFSLLIVSSILAALDHAHRHRGDDGEPRPIVHRDVSPSNILVSLEGEVKLCDFGIARAQDELVDVQPAEGKAGYMSPEQAMGRPIDARADVFAAGIILWELIAGRRLYRAREGEVLLELAQRADIPALPRRELPSEETLHELVSRALSRDPAGRFASSAAMLRAIEDYAAPARLLASPLRFGAWLMDHFGHSLVAARRGRERALRALLQGPPVRIEPIGRRGADGVIVPWRAQDAEPAATDPASAPVDATSRPEAREPLAQSASSRPFRGRPVLVVLTIMMLASAVLYLLMRPS